MPITFHQLTDQDYMVQLPNFHVDSIDTLFTKFVDNHPFINQKNIFYTASSVSVSDRNSLLEQNIVPFDVDNIPDEENKDLYMHIFSQFTGIPTQDFITINTGHGLHMLVRTQVSITDESAFTTLRKSYHYVCDILDGEFAKANLTGKMDRGVFKKTQLLRMPNTINHKPKRYAVDSLCTYVGGKAVPQPLDLLRLSGADKHYVKPEHQIRTELPPADTEAVMAGCDFMKMCASGVPLSEPQWYGMLGILSKCKDGKKLAHEISALDHNRYEHEDTERKFKQADESCKGRLCSSILPLWDGCETCPNFNKVNTPLMLRGEDYIATEHTSFHYEGTKNNKPAMLPSIPDLAKYLVREKLVTSYYDKKGSTRMYFNGKCWDNYPDTLIEYDINVAFRPYTVKHNIVTETIHLTDSTREPVPYDHLTRHNDYICLENGDFNSQTGRLEPHDPSHMAFFSLTYPYDPEAKCPSFDYFMESSVPDPEQRNTLLEFMGATLFDLSSRQYGKICLLIGPTANGKSVLGRLFSLLVGRQYVSTDSLDAKSLNATGALSSMEGKKVNFIDEGKPDMFSHPLIKTIIEGNQLTINPKFKDQKEAVLNAKIYACYNDIPKIVDSLEAVRRRLLVIEMPFSFKEDNPQRDIELDNKLSKELSGIFNTLLAAVNRLTVRGKYDVQSEGLKRSSNNFMGQANRIEEWASTCLEHINVLNDDFIKVSDLYTEYAQWVRDTNPENFNVFIENINKFGRAMANKFGEAYGVTKRTENGTAKCLVGYKLKEEDDGAF